MSYQARTASGLSTQLGDDWRDAAACRKEDPELFFPVGTTGPARFQALMAKAVCARCPVVDACLRWALDLPLAEGIAGGLTAEERRLVLTEQDRRANHAQRVNA